MVIQFIGCRMSDPSLAQQLRTWSPEVSNVDPEVYAQWVAYWAQQQAAFGNSPSTNGQQTWPPSSYGGPTLQPFTKFFTKAQ